MPLVRRLAGRIFARRVGAELEFADLLQLGTVGLLEAIDRFAPDRGAKFETYAAYRIEGAILNGLSAYSELQRRLAVRRGLIRARTESLRGGAGVPGKSALERFADLAVGVALGLTLDDIAETHEEPSQPDTAYARVEMAQFRSRLSALLGQLPEAERLVVSRHYLQQQAFDEIAQALGVSRGRVSQIHHAALRRLREALRGAKVDTWME